MVLRTTAIIGLLTMLGACATGQLTGEPQPGVSRLTPLGTERGAEQYLVWGSDRSVKGSIFNREMIREGLTPVIVLPGDTEVASGKTNLELAQLMARFAAKSGRPAIGLERPFAGDIRNRRTDREARMYRSIIASLQHDLGFTNYILVAHSGAVGIGTERFSNDSNVVCLISAAGTLDLAGHQISTGSQMGGDEFSPMDRINKLPINRPFIHVHDRKDTVVPLSSAQNYANRIPSSIPFTFLAVDGFLGPEHHWPFNYITEVIEKHCNLPDDSPLPAS